MGGFATVFDPKLLRSPLGLILDDIGIHAFREGGALLLGVGIIYWFARNDGPSNTQKGILYGSFISSFMITILILLAIINELINTLALLNFVLIIIITAGWGYFIFKDRSNQSQV